METVNEKTVAVLSLIFKDEDNALISPSAATYQIDDLNTGTSIVASTAITVVGGMYDVIITAAQNAIVDTTRSYETKVVTVAWTYGTGTAYGDYRYRVKNLFKVT
jgi:hypothetical protein